MVRKLSPEEEKLVETVIDEVKKLTKKYGYEYVIIGCNRYIKNTKAKKKLLDEIRQREKELNDLKNSL